MLDVVTQLVSVTSKSVLSVSGEVSLGAGIPVHEYGVHRPHHTNLIPSLGSS